MVAQHPATVLGNCTQKVERNQWNSLTVAWMEVEKQISPHLILLSCSPFPDTPAGPLASQKEFSLHSAKELWILIYSLPSKNAFKWTWILLKWLLLRWEELCDQGYGILQYNMSHEIQWQRLEQRFPSLRIFIIQKVIVQILWMSVIWRYYCKDNASLVLFLFQKMRRLSLKIRKHHNGKSFYNSNLLDVSFLGDPTLPYKFK